MSDITMPVRRTHTPKSLTVRESCITLYLQAKCADSPPPKGFKIDKATLNRAFGVVSAFAEACFEECAETKVELTKLAKAGDDEAAKQLAQLVKQIDKMNKFRASEKFDRIKELSTAAKREAARKVEAESKKVVDETASA